jgi:hypothetical protein
MVRGWRRPGPGQQRDAAGYLGEDCQVNPGRLAPGGQIPQIRRPDVHKVCGQMSAFPEWLTANVRYGGPPPDNDSLNLDLARLDLSCRGAQAEPPGYLINVSAIGNPA